jgi:4-amino-4-deoxy-L-arabinose transferase-like glycosyltransferase
VLLAIIALAFALRASNLEHIPSLVLGDETKYGVAARDLYEAHLIKPFTTGVDGHWNFYLQIIGLFLQLFGPTVTAIRLPSVLAGTLSVVATYAVVRQLWGPRAALIAAALLACFPHNIHFSRLGFNSIDDPLFMMLVFGCVWLAWRTGRRRVWIMAALAAGISQYFFVGGRLVLVQLAVLAAFWSITERRRVRAQLLNIALAAGVFACIVAPIMYFAVIRPDDYLSSLNAKNIYRSGWLTARMQVTGESEINVLWGQLRDVITSFSFGSDESFYWGQPILTPLMTILAVIALGYCVLHLREGPYFWLVSAFALLVVFGGILVVSPTAGSHRLLGSGPLLYSAIAVTLDRGWQRAEQRWPQQVPIALAGTVVIGLLMLADARTYFVDYLTVREPYSPESKLNLVQRYVIDLGPRTEPQPVQIVCVGITADYCKGTTVDLLARSLLARADVITDAPGVAAVPPPGSRPQFVIINASLAREVNLARARYPYVPSRNLIDGLGNIDFVAFEVPAQ